MKDLLSGKINTASICLDINPWRTTYHMEIWREEAGVWHLLTPAVPTVCSVPPTSLQLRKQPGAVPFGLMEEWYAAGRAKCP